MRLRLTMLLDLGLSQISLSRSLFPRPCPVRVEQQRAAPGHADHPIHRFTVIPGEGTPKTLDPILNQTFDGCVQYWGKGLHQLLASAFKDENHWTQHMCVKLSGPWTPKVEVEALRPLKLWHPAQSLLSRGKSAERGFLRKSVLITSVGYQWV